MGFMGLAGLTWACSSPVAPVEEDLTQYVNPFIGTDLPETLIRVHKCLLAWFN